MFELNGAPYTLPSNDAVSSTLSKTFWVTRRSGSPSYGSNQPALANSAVQITSMAMMSTVESSAPSRRTSCSRGLVGEGGQQLELDVVAAVGLLAATLQRTSWIVPPGLDLGEPAKRGPGASRVLGAGTARSPGNGRQHDRQTYQPRLALSAVNRSSSRRVGGFGAYLIP